jgi:hypothetical protein
MSKKDLFLAKLEATKIEASNTNIFVKPTKNIDSGLLGKLYEMEIKKALGCMNGKNISKATQVDTRKNGFAIEIKQGASEIEMLFTNKKIDYIFYCPDFLESDNVMLCTYVLTKSDFLQVLESCGLIRMKTSTSGQVKHTIQSYKNSNKKYNLFLDGLEEHSETISEWLERTSK